MRKRKIFSLLQKLLMGCLCIFLLISIVSAGFFDIFKSKEDNKELVEINDEFNITEKKEVVFDCNLDDNEPLVDLICVSFEDKRKQDMKLLDEPLKQKLLTLKIDNRCYGVCR